jgi:tRNA threonylcarbamoyl adenosine modification protein YeaZ
MDTRLIDKPIHYLILDTSTPILRIGIWNATKKKLLSHASGTNPYDTTTSFFARLDECLLESDVTLDDINLIIAITGPGSFTSLRAGLSITKGLSLAKNIPTIGLTSFEAFFASLSDYEHNQFLILLDTMKDDFYAGLLNKQGTFIQPPFSMLAKNLETFVEPNTFIIGNADHPKITKIEIDLSKIASYVFEKTSQGIEMNSNIAPFYLKDPVYIKS